MVAYWMHLAAAQRSAADGCGVLVEVDRLRHALFDPANFRVLVHFSTTLACCHPHVCRVNQSVLQTLKFSCSAHVSNGPWPLQGVLEPEWQ